MADDTGTVVGRKPDSDLSPQEVGERIIGLCKDFPQGLSDKVLQNEMPGIEPKSRALAINQLLNTGKIDLLTSAEGVVFYKLKGASKASGVRGDQEEKIVFGIIEEAGNTGTWIRDIRIKSNLGQVQLNRVLKSLENKKHIKAVKSVNATRKKVYMLYGLEPDRSVTGGAWYTDQEFESEFVEILNQQSYNYLYEKLEKSRQAGSNTGPMAARSMSMATSKEVSKYISDLGISKIELKEEDIEAILDTLIYDGKLEKTTKVIDGNEVKYYRAVESLLPTNGLVRIPCGVCPVYKNCHDTLGAVNPVNCQYLTEWMP